MESLYTFLITVPLALVLLGLGYTILSNVLHLWLDHHVKLKLLEKLESRPELLRSFDELRDLLDDSPKAEEERAQIDYLITGVVLGLMGVVFAISSQTMGVGRMAVGFYFGGVACVALGFILSLVGLLTRFLSRTPVTREGVRPPWYRRWLRSKPTE
ncbi:MAG: hypothetical protein GC168_12775 [Candidatus Hydrogenedens sp.]|nr:hypothetical protein [Candidatus Hydrogenedens sp.]